MIHVPLSRILGVVGVASASVFFSTAALAERPAARESVGGRASGGGPSGDPQFQHELPLFYRSTAGTTWVRVHNAGLSPCAPEDVVGEPNYPTTDRTIDEVWCFERVSGAGGDSSWPAVPAAQNTGSRHERWDHWSKFAPPVTPLSKWHLTRSDSNASTWNAWCGCDSLVGVPGYSNNDAACAEPGYWINRKGYGNDWNYALELRADGASNATGSTVKFDVRYDVECNYDYLYVEYSTNLGTTWSPVRDAYPSGTAAVFNAISGNPDAAHGGVGRSCGGDYFHASDQFDPGGGIVPWYGHSLWVANAIFSIPPGGTNGVRVRWRAFSDGAWSDADGRGDTDGHSAVDNVVLTIASGGTSAADDFESATGAPLNGRVPPFVTIPGAVSWAAGSILGNTYDGWHLEFDPKYANKGNTCTFSDDWMWAAKPAVGAIPPSGNGFDFFLASPVIDCDGWNAGVSIYDEYFCVPSNTRDFKSHGIRVYDTMTGWSPWNDFGEGFDDAGCEGWRTGRTDDFTPYLGPTVDSLQLGFELIDFDQPGDMTWGKHATVQYLIDNVSIGSFDPAATQFYARAIDVFTDTFSLSDPAHTPFLENADQGNWIGTSGTRPFAGAESLSVEVGDPNGISASNVDLWWRHDDGGSVSFGAFQKIDMTYSIQNPLSPTDEGTYRAIIGRDDGGGEDVDGTSANGLVWKAATTVQYYVKVTDDAANVSVFPASAGAPSPSYFNISVLPLGKTTPAGASILLVDDFGRSFLDFANSIGFDPDGGSGDGAFSLPAFASARMQVEEALAQLFGGSPASPKWDVYDVGGAGSSVQSEPNGTARPTDGVGGFLTSGGAPVYDAIVWLQGDFNGYLFTDESLAALQTYLDAGGRLLTLGDDIAFGLGAGGSGTDTTIAFLRDYLGTTFANVGDQNTDERNLYIQGDPGGSLGGATLGLYGACPDNRRFDRLTLASPPPQSQNATLATYVGGSAGDNGRAAVIKNVRRGADAMFSTADDGVGTLVAFDASAFYGDVSRGCLFARVFMIDFGFTLAYLPVCPGATDAPAPVAAVFGFDLQSATPNPFTASTDIRFSIARRDPVTLEIYDVGGRRLRVLQSAALDAGVHVRSWDGRSEGGERVANGIYFVKMATTGYVATKKVVLLK